MKTMRTLILIDGSNFYFKLKDLKLHNLLDFNFSAFIKLIIRERSHAGCNYYIGAIRTDGTEKTQNLFNNQRKLFTHLRQNKVRYILGYLLKSGGVFHEKGVDVNIAVDMLVAAYEDSADDIILVSSDTDLLPAIKKAKSRGKKVEYIGFSHQPSLAMVANCSTSRLLGREDLLPFCKKAK